MGLLPDGMPHAHRASGRPVVDWETSRGMSCSEASRNRVFWILLCAVVLVAASVQACLAHITAIFADTGASAKTAALATSLYGGGLLVGRAGSGYLLDRFFAPRVAALIFASAALGIGLLRLAASQQFAFVAAFLIGLGNGAEVDIMAYLISRYFGLRAFGTIYGFIFGGFGLAGGLGVYLMGASFDATGSYRSMLTVFCLAALFGAALMLRLGPYRFRAALTDKAEAVVDVLAT